MAEKTLVCLTLTGKTLLEDFLIFEKYARYIDLVELRADFLTEEEQLNLRRFPSMVSVPCILTIRRECDGGKYTSSEFSRTVLFGRALSFAEENTTRNFAYVDFEEDFNVSGLYDSALAFGIKVIRSCHKFDGPITNIREKCLQLRKTDFEIPKIAFMPKTTSDVTHLFAEAENMTDFPHILIAMGALGVPSRILSNRLHSYLTFTSPEQMDSTLGEIGHLDPVTLSDLYNFSEIDETTEVYAVTGYPLKVTSSPVIHNAGYRTQKMNRVFIPFPSTSIGESFEFAKQIGIKGMAVTVPYKEELLKIVENHDDVVREIGSSNTLVFDDEKWILHNTDAEGFSRALCEFLGVEKLKRRKVAIIGAGGAAKAIAYAVKKLGAKACVFNRTVSKAKDVATKFGFEYDVLGEESLCTLEKYADIIIQTTNVGMNSLEPPSKNNNPIWFYNFKGTESVFDIVYDPSVTPIMQVAKEKGCRVCNGMSMLKYQGYKQFEYFTGAKYDGNH